MTGGFAGDLGFSAVNGAEPASTVDVDAIVNAAREKQLQASKFEARGIDELLSMRDPEWLIRGIVPEQSFGVIYGPPGSGKSFLAIDYALCVASGTAWFGRPVKQKTVVYVAGEGVAGLKRRVEAWLEAHSGAEPRGRFFLVPEAPNLLDSEHVLRLAATLGHVRKTTDEACGLLIVDTLARSMAGGDENSVKDVGLVIEHLDQLSRPHAAIVLHHSQKASTAERGSSSLRGAADLMIRVAPAKGDRTRFTISCEKAKDAEPFDEIKLAMVPTASSISLVADLTATLNLAEDRKHRLLAFIAQCEKPATKRAMRNNIGGRNEAVDQALERLIFEGKVERVSSGWRACPVPRDTPGHGGHMGAPGGLGSPSPDVPIPVPPRRGGTGDTAGDPAGLWNEESVSRVPGTPEADPFADVESSASTAVEW